PAEAGTGPAEAGTGPAWARTAAAPGPTRRTATPAAGPQTAGPQTAGPQTAGPQTAGPQTAGLRLAGLRMARRVAAPGPARRTARRAAGPRRATATDDRPDLTAGPGPMAAAGSRCPLQRGAHGGAPPAGDAPKAATVHGNAFAGIPQGCMLTSALRL